MIPFLFDLLTLSICFIHLQAKQAQHHLSINNITKLQMVRLYFERDA
jgi:hypothetical protein